MTTHTLTAPIPDESDDRLAEEHGPALLRIVAGAIRHGLDHGRPPPAHTISDLSALAVPRATFVTLEEDGALRGCIGTLDARESLAESVARQAYGAAFHDPRFAPVDKADWPRLAAGISILSPCQPLAAASEPAALAALRPHVDGLVLTDGHRKAVFLPQVWEQLPEPRRFVAMLKRKAGLDETHWSDTLRLERFTVAKVPATGLASFY